ncbi:hypothetical protein [Sphingomonas aracearum]|uniref:hypothetical protein n=1 Tax=Sphingomonas aracearum TaxID=2283317 RepID=UPI0011C06A3B|nr:hypothetical protein [Sphingomonas aracearum]
MDSLLTHDLLAELAAQYSTSPGRVSALAAIVHQAGPGTRNWDDVEICEFWTKVDQHRAEHGLGDAVIAGLSGFAFGNEGNGHIIEKSDPIGRGSTQLTTMGVKLFRAIATLLSQIEVRSEHGARRTSS